MTNRQREHYTAVEAAVELCVSIRTVKRWLEAGIVPGAFRLPSGQWRIPRAHLDVWTAPEDD